jgi:hypothetical protein
MEFRPDSSLLVQTALSMSLVSDEGMSPEAAEIAKIVRLVLGGDSTAFEQIIQRYETRVMTMAARLLVRGTKLETRHRKSSFALSSTSTGWIFRNLSNPG